MDQETANFVVVPWSFAAFLLIFGIGFIVKGCLNAPVPPEAYNDEKHRYYKRARSIYATTYDSRGWSRKGENDWEFEIAFGIILLSLPVSGIVAFDPFDLFKYTPDGSILAKVRTAAIFYLLSYILVLPFFIYLGTTMWAVQGVAELYRGCRWLIGKPLPPKSKRQSSSYYVTRVLKSSCPRGYGVDVSQGDD
ncbi:MAG: hypothetical protein A2731_00815 [Candidatus Buchananbacteria bacterium RIFCSPHIGHO2_01_FULL_39_8]|uniref:Uncharacterized protein n=1 Tax=Candidatus Buchananbacteria bacterium RIFCSPHIGHO2_01_FULL_39_8 TaxID=1797533 RepID=A0A1G1Y1K4_9BACT|nr:MAG: hypothetical protein A2731_00815 [Candidatus Buchananbacteria bacterium RIFCSPHIGHO2_01_FULL_39_8]